MASNGDLCESCQAREAKTQIKVAEIAGANTTIGGLLPSYLMGRVTEPIPFWSRLYDGAWYRLKIESGCTVSEQTMAKAKKATAVAYEGVTPVEPQPLPAKKRGNKKVAVVPVAVAVVPVVPVVPAVPAPVAVAEVQKPKAEPKKRQPKKTAVPAATPVAMIPDPMQEVPVETVREVKVRKREIDGRSLYLGPKDKVYDLKFKYLGRLKEDKIVAFPDSDEGF